MALHASTSKLQHFSEPQPGASLLLAFDPPAATVKARRTVLIVGQQRLAAARAFACLESGLKVVLACDKAAPSDPEVQSRLDDQQIFEVPLLDPALQDDQESWSNWLDDLPRETLRDVLLVCVTDTIFCNASTSRSATSALALRNACFDYRIPVNIADRPDLSDFVFPATHRFPLLQSSASSQEDPSPLQIAITTNAKSCRLASRIRREIVTRLPRDIGNAVAKVGALREMARQADEDNAHDFEQGEREEGWSTTLLNKPVPQILAPITKSRCTSPARTMKLATAGHKNEVTLLTPPATPPADSILVNRMEQILSGQTRTVQDLKINNLTRMRFIAQISEYWPIERLASITDEEAARVISLYFRKNWTETTNGSASHVQLSTNGGLGGPNHSSHQGVAEDLTDASIAPRHQLALQRPLASPSKQGRIFLLGSGPGSPALLTMAAHALLTKHATLILSDKLVPPQILALIPKHIPLTIAKKFPGNAEGAQNELMDLALEGALRGETVVRLKQGDPYVYGRGGEEVLFFRERGFEAVVVPGISSAFAAPLMAGIPVTQRGVSESVLLTTGVGRKGKGVKIPGYERARTVVMLMGVARLAGVVQALTSVDGQEGHGREGGNRDGAAYPPYCPIAIIERGSSPDQRMVASTLDGIVEAMERAGDQRPPGMMVIGWSPIALEGEGDVEVLDGVEGLSAEETEKLDRVRVAKWLGPKGYIVREGLHASWFDIFDKEEQARTIE